MKLLHKLLEVLCGVERWVSLVHDTINMNGNAVAQEKAHCAVLVMFLILKRHYFDTMCHFDFCAGIGNDGKGDGRALYSAAFMAKSSFKTGGAGHNCLCPF